MRPAGSFVSNDKWTYAGTDSSPMAEAAPIKKPRGLRSDPWSARMVIHGWAPPSEPVRARWSTAGWCPDDLSAFLSQVQGALGSLSLEWAYVRPDPACCNAVLLWDVVAAANPSVSFTTTALRRWQVKQPSRHEVHPGNRIGREREPVVRNALADELKTEVGKRRVAAAVAEIRALKVYAWRPVTVAPYIEVGRGED